MKFCILEPPPTFTWTHPVHGDMSSNEDYLVLHEEYQGGSTTTLVVNHAKVYYTLFEWFLLDEIVTYGGTPSLSSKYAYHLIFRPWMPAHIH